MTKTSQAKKLISSPLNIQPQISRAALLKQSINDALSRMDSLTGSNAKLTGELGDRKTEIDNLKSQIKTELSKKNADLNKAHEMVKQLNGKITDLLAQVEQLKQENQTLTVANTMFNNTARYTYRNRKHALSRIYQLRRY